MHRIEKDWYSKEDKLSISLMRFHVSIQQVIKVEEDVIYWQIIITNSNMEELIIGFASQEECLYFTEKYVSKAYDFEDILKKKKEYRKERKERGKVKVRHITKNRK